MEWDKDIAAIYKDFFPQDNVIVADAHEYLLEHFEEYDFIWSSPPCPSHSRIRIYTAVAKGANKPIYPDMKLYEEILLLQGYFKGKWCVENVISWYDPLIPPLKIADHYFWTNFLVPDVVTESRNHHASSKDLSERKGFDLSKYKGIDKTKILRNCVEPEVGKKILEYAITPIKLQRELAI